MKKVQINDPNYSDLMVFSPFGLRLFISCLGAVFVAIFGFPHLFLMLVLFVAGSIILLHLLICHNYRVINMQKNKQFIAYNILVNGTLFWPLNKGNSVSSELVSEGCYEIKVLGGLASIGYVFIISILINKYFF